MRVYCLYCCRHFDTERQTPRIEALFKALALKVESITFLVDGEQPPLSSSSVVGHVSVFVPMKVLIDPKAGVVLQEDLDGFKKQHDQIATKLSRKFCTKSTSSRC